MNEMEVCIACDLRSMLSPANKVKAHIISSEVLASPSFPDHDYCSLASWIQIYMSSLRKPFRVFGRCDKSDYWKLLFQMARTSDGNMVQLMWSAGHAQVIRGRECESSQDWWWVQVSWKEDALTHLAVSVLHGKHGRQSSVATLTWSSKTANWKIGCKYNLRLTLLICCKKSCNRHAATIQDWRAGPRIFFISPLLSALLETIAQDFKQEEVNRRVFHGTWSY